MIEDPIVNEIRKYRQAHAERYGNDLMKIAEALRVRHEPTDRKYINRGPKILPKKKAG